MKVFSKDELVARLKREGLVFSEFSLRHDGNYAVDDADWNYTDVPHLHHVHRLVEAVLSVVTHDTIATINMQKVLGFTFPMSVFNYQSRSNEHTYYTTWLFFVLIVQTRYEALASNRTRVTTTYAVGSPWWLKWCFPLIHWVLKRNYDNLMSSDIPMRMRRGELRSWGYSFDKGGSRYSFERTMNIARSNVVVPPATSPAPLRISIHEQVPRDGEYFFGKSDHVGVRVVRTGRNFKLYPRMCPHEGACLDTQLCVSGRIQCPWHGRTFEPLAVFDLGNPVRQSVATQAAEYTFENSILTAKPTRI